MSEQFNVGEVVILLADPALAVNFDERYDRQDVEVIGHLMRRLWSDGVVRSSYLVRSADGTELRAAPHELRRKRPPSRECDEVVSWDDCAWRPKHKEAA